MVKFEPIDRKLTTPKRRTYRREDYQNMINWVESKVDFRETRERLKKFKEELDKLAEEVSKGVKDVESALKEAVNLRDAFEKAIRSAFRKELLEKVRDAAVKRYGDEVGRKVTRGWRTALSLDSYGLFSDLRESIAPLPSEMDVVRKILVSRPQDYVYLRAGKEVKVYRWLPVEVEILKEMVRKGKTAKEIQKVMPYRTISSIRHKIYRIREQ